MKFDIKELLSNKMVKTAIIVVMVVILLIIGISVYFSIKGRRINDYSVLENTVLNAAKKYYKENSDRLPKEIGSTSSIDDLTLSADGYMKEMINIAPKEVSCKAEAFVKNVNGAYSYYVDLDCGDNYNSETLADHILANQPVVTTGDGLYENNGDYVYRGEFVNNYLSFAGRIYQIVSVNSDKSITIINSTRDKKLDRPSWDDRYNPDSGYGKNGINDYTVSRIKEFLTDYVNGSAFSDSDRSKLMYQSLCIGKVGENDKLSRNMECSVTYDNQIIGLLPVSNFDYVSLDSECTTVSDKSCQNYNYLSKFDTSWWTLTGATEKTYRSYVVGYKSSATVSNCSNESYPREVLRLTNLVGYSSGNGTEMSPFVIK